MPGHVFISYRRSDSTKDARALFERLRREFGDQRVFIDLEGIDPGEDFVDSLERQLDGCGVLVAVIGKHWADARNERGDRRLDDENDFVRIELRAAFARRIKVFPVLIDDAMPPKAEELPEELRALVRRQAISLDYAKFDADVARLCRAIRKVLDGPDSPASTPVEPHRATEVRTGGQQPPAPHPPAASAESVAHSPARSPWITRSAAMAIAAAIVAALAWVVNWPDRAPRAPSPVQAAAPTNSAPEAAEPATLAAAPATAVGRYLSGQGSAPPMFNEYRTSHILVATEAEAKSLIEQIKGGAKFEDVARAKSKDPGSAEQGGALGFLSPDAVVPAYSLAMLALQKGQMTDSPVKSEFGYHIIRMDDIRSKATNGSKP